VVAYVGRLELPYRAIRRLIHGRKSVIPYFTAIIFFLAISYQTPNWIWSKMTKVVYSMPAALNSSLSYIWALLAVITFWIYRIKFAMIANLASAVANGDPEVY
jgi:hypothetical protein